MGCLFIVDRSDSLTTLFGWASESDKVISQKVTQTQSIQDESLFNNALVSCNLCVC